jgi:hypothetical protein
MAEIAAKNGGFFFPSSMVHHLRSLTTAKIAEALTKKGPSVEPSSSFELYQQTNDTSMALIGTSSIQNRFGRISNIY